MRSNKIISIDKCPMAMQCLKEAAEKAKIELSSSMETEINLPYITVADGVPQHLVMKLTRARLLTAMVLIKQCFRPMVLPQSFNFN